MEAIKTIAGLVFIGAMIAGAVLYYSGYEIEDLPDLPVVPDAIAKKVDTSHTTDDERQGISQPELRHLELKQYMLELVNQARATAQVPQVSLGKNPAAQLHAEAALEGCYSAHWDQWGLKPNHRYTLTGGSGANGENGSGSDYCIKAHENYASIKSMRDEVREAVTGWMQSPGHRKNLLDPAHAELNIGIAHDRYNTVMVQDFSSDYVSYSSKPHITGNGILFLEAEVSQATLEIGNTTNIQLYYDPPPKNLSRGQLSHTYALCNSEKIGKIVKPLSGGRYYIGEPVQLETSERNCIDPYETPANWPAPQSNDEANEAWAKAKALSQVAETRWERNRRIIAEEMQFSTNNIKVKADLSPLLQEKGPGIYTVILWGKPLHMNEPTPLSKQAIFWQVQPPKGNPYIHHREPSGPMAEWQPVTTEAVVAEAHGESAYSPHWGPEMKAAAQSAKSATNEGEPRTTPAPKPLQEPTWLPTTQPPAPTVQPPPTYSVLRGVPTLVGTAPVQLVLPTPVHQPIGTEAQPVPGTTKPQAPQIPTMVLQPAATPLPVTMTYTSPGFGYSIEAPYGWTVTQEGEKTRFQSPDNTTTYIEIERLSVTRDQSIGDIADQYMWQILDQAPGWENVFVEWDIPGNKNSSGPYIGLNFSWKKPEHNCVQAGQTHIFRSRHAPKDLVGYALTMASCQGGRKPPGEEFRAYLETFKE